jgi:hypothetical protein
MSGGYADEFAINLDAILASKAKEVGWNGESYCRGVWREYEKNKESLSNIVELQTTLGNESNRNITISEWSKLILCEWSVRDLWKVFTDVKYIQIVSICLLICP